MNILAANKTAAPQVGAAGPCPCTHAHTHTHTLPYHTPYTLPQFPFLLTSLIHSHLTQFSIGQGTHLLYSYGPADSAPVNNAVVLTLAGTGNNWEAC